MLLAAFCLITQAQGTLHTYGYGGQMDAALQVLGWLYHRLD